VVSFTPWPLYPVETFPGIGYEVGLFPDPALAAIVKRKRRLDVKIT
jgi:hypothetical protein